MQKTSSETNGQRFYPDPADPDAPALPSVTTILQALSKPALLPWYASTVAAAAVAAIRDGVGVEDLAEDYDRSLKNPPKQTLTPYDKARRYLAAAPNRARGTSANLGTLIHAVADALSTDSELPDTSAYDPALISAYVARFMSWRSEYDPTFVLTEVEVINRAVGYGGRLDCLLAIPGIPGLFLNDYKTGKDIYPEVALQLAAYANAEEYWLDGEPHDMPGGIDHLSVLHLTDKAANFLEVSGDVTPAEHWDRFQDLAGLWRWQQATSSKRWYSRIA